MAVLRYAFCLGFAISAAAGGGDGVEPAPRDQIEVLMENGELEKALPIVNAALREKPDDQDFLLLKGAILRRLKRHAEAIETYDRILGLFPDNKVARNLQTLLLLQEARAADSAEAPRLMAKALQLSGNAPEIVEEAIVLFARCGLYAETTKLYESAPGKAWPRYLAKIIAESYHHRGYFSEAARLYQAILRADPSDHDAAFALTLVRLDAGEYEAALETAQHALAEQPANVDLLMTIVAIHWLSGDLPAANKTLDRVMAINSRHTGAAGLKLELLSEMGCISLALEFAETHASAVSAELRRDIRRRFEKSTTEWKEYAKGFSPGSRFTALGYGEVARTAGDSSALPVRNLVEQLEFLKFSGCRFLKGLDLLEAAGKKQDLPPRSVLLVFEGPFKTFSSVVLPVLELYDFPAVLAVCSAWVEDGPPAGATSPIMSWDDIRRMTEHRLLSLGSLTHSMNRRVSSGAGGGTGSAATTRIYSPRTSEYESDEAYRQRIARDLKNSKEYIRVRTGNTPYLLFWPFATYNRIALEESRRVGFVSLADLRQSGADRRSAPMDRWIIGPGMSMETFVEGFAEHSNPPAPLKDSTRSFRVSMDLLAGKNTEERKDAVAALIERARAMGVDTVYIKAFADVRTGDQADAVYFPNRILPVRKDLLAEVVAAVREGGLAAHVCVPSLGIRLPGEYLKPEMQVMESRLGNVRITTTSPRRLSPFSTEAFEQVKAIYSDLSAHVAFDGIVFLEDAFLTDFEDFNPAGIERLRDLGTTEINPRLLSAGEKARWTRIKTRQVDRFLAALMEAVRGYRPNAVFSRVLYAPALHTPSTSAEWLAQDFETTLAMCDRVIVLADPEAENAGNAEAWLRMLTEAAAAGFPHGLQKTVFQLNSYDPFKERWITERELARRIESLAESGARHISYSPDNFESDRPRLKAAARFFAKPE